MQAVREQSGDDRVGDAAEDSTTTPEDSVEGHALSCPGAEVSVLDRAAVTRVMVPPGLWFTALLGPH